MNVQDIKESLRDFWREYRRIKSGMAGLILLLIFIFFTFLGPMFTAFPEAGPRWRDTTYWMDNPRAASPSWVNMFSSQKLCKHTILEEYQVENGITIFKYDYPYDEPPSDIILYLEGVGKCNLTIERPDGEIIPLMDELTLYSGENRFVLAASQEVKKNVRDFAIKREGASAYSPFMNPLLPIFSKENLLSEEAIPLKGEYLLKIGGEIKGGRAIFSGSVFGVLGTDAGKRDLFAGIIGGAKAAFIVGFLAAPIAVIIGIFFGLINGYTKGVKSEGMLMVNDFAYNLPLLPILIVISYTYGITIIKFALIYALLAWGTTARVSRSIALQIKEQQYVEAAKAQGASSARILLKHMLPAVMPYAFAQIALAIPGVILLEASISFLGLGDPTIATWGQILNDAQRANATLGGLWWWVIPPGLAIFFVAFTFFLVGTSLDTILNPKLRVR